MNCFVIYIIYFLQLNILTSSAFELFWGLSKILELDQNIWGAKLFTLNFMLQWLESVVFNLFKCIPSFHILKLFIPLFGHFKNFILPFDELNTVNSFRVQLSALSRQVSELESLQ